ncbi:MAG: hypothetical protein WBH44_01530 [Proteocatella sp.]
MKRIIPIVLTILVCLFTSFYAFGLFFISLEESFFLAKLFTFMLALIPIGIIIAMVFTLIERLKEIKEEDEDDISKY